MGRITKQTNARIPAVLAFIVDYKKTHNGNSPTVRDIVAGSGPKSTSHVLYVLRQMTKQGVIRMYGVRQIEVPGYSWRPE